MIKHQSPDHIKHLTFADRDTWLAARGKDITASVVGALFNVHEYTSPYELWALKAGLLRPEQLDNSALERGELLEPVAVRLMGRRRPEWEILHNTGPDTVYFRDPVNRIGATPDTLVMCPDRGLGTVQIKSVEQTVYRRKWAPDGSEPEPPLWIAMQALLEAHMTGSKWAAVAPLVVGFGIDLPIIDIPMNPRLIPAIVQKTAEFWQLVESGDEPPADYSRDRATIEGMYPTDDGGEVDLVGNRRTDDLIAERAGLKDQGKATEARLSEIDAELKHQMQGASLAYLSNGQRMTWRTQRRFEPNGTQNTLRVLRVPRPYEYEPPQPITTAPAVKKRKPAQDNEPWTF